MRISESGACLLDEEEHRRGQHTEVADAVFVTPAVSAVIDRYGNAVFDDNITDGALAVAGSPDTRTCPAFFKVCIVNGTKAVVAVAVDIEKSKLPKK